MPNEWEKARIKDIGRVVTGRTPPGTHSNFFGSEVPFITPTDMDGRRTIDQPSRFLSQEGAAVLKSNLVSRGVAVSCIGWQMGKSVLIEQTSATNQQINTIIPDERVVDLEFLYYAMSMRREEIFRLGSGGSRTPILNKTGFEHLVLDLPPLPEQCAIAHVLGALDDKIELNRRMIGTLEAMARAIFKSWFVDFDPVRAKADGRQPEGMDAETAALFPDSFEDSDLGKTPAGWVVVPLSRLIEINPLRPLKRGEPAPYLDMQNMPVRGHRAISWIERSFGSGIKFMNGDTLLARITPCLENGKTAFVDFLEDGQVGWGSTEFIVFRPKPPVAPEYAYYLARSDELRAFAIRT